jgi:tRNA modification GTPase
MYVNDTIAAIATPLGPGGVGIVRLSGPLCAAIADALVIARRPASRWTSHHMYRGRLHDADGAVLDDALAVLMRAPRSYTGEDVLELHCHGSPAVLRQVLARVLACGARPAQPGEFTKRAFLNGRLDLAQAEAVIDLVRARNPGAAQLAAQQLGGRLSAELDALRTRLIRVKALLEAQIDFADEDIEVAPDEMFGNIDWCISLISSIMDTYNHGKLFRDGLRVAIVGKPNVGKSSLLNALLGEDRAIVTPIAGTTRDAIEESADFDGVAVVLTDTAGLRQMEAADPVERMGMQRTSQTIADSQLVLAVLDASVPLESEDVAVLDTARELPRVLVLNKIDLGRPVFDAAALAHDSPVVEVSATQRAGLAELRRAVVTAVSGGATIEPDVPVLVNVRHHAALTQALQSLRLARESISAGQLADLVAVDVQDAIDHVGTITGIVTSEDVLDRIFSEFCIGK